MHACDWAKQASDPWIVPVSALISSQLSGAPHLHVVMYNHARMFVVTIVYTCMYVHVYVQASRALP